MLDILLLVPEITKGMKSLGSKALLGIKNSTMVLDYQIQQLKKLDQNANIFIGTGFESDKIRKAVSKYNKVNVLHFNYSSFNYFHHFQNAQLKVNLSKAAWESVEISVVDMTEHKNEDFKWICYLQDIYSKRK